LTGGSRASRRLLFMCELFQRAGSRKVRGDGGTALPPASPGPKICGALITVLQAIGTHSSRNRGQAPKVNAVVVPSGGMIAGVAVAIKALRVDVKVFAAELRSAEGCHRSKVRGGLTRLHPLDTITDAVKTSIGPNTRPVIRDLVDDIVTVSEEEIKRATWLVWERMKLLIEPTAGLSERFQAVPWDVENVCIMLCRGNMDLSSLTWLKDLPGKAE
ncbi:LOW QUALITY PROTEIN: serine racemase, partial [Morus bassanus]